jgi:phosphoribosylformylglycinamidine synthase
LEFLVNVVVSNKPSARDPEGETIQRDLVGSDYGQVRSVRVGKLLRLRVEAKGPAEAEAFVRRLCDELRIYNPAAHSCEVTVGRLPG